MSAYATRQREQSARLFEVGTVRPGAEQAAGAAAAMHRGRAAVSGRLADPGDRGDEWFDSSQAAEYLGLHRDTLRRLAPARAIPTEQDGRGCKLFFRRSALDEWRRSGGRVRHVAALADVA